MTGDDLVRSATRVLALLEALNERDNATLVFLAERTQLPKATIVRLLHTLEHAGFVHKLSRSEGYALTERVLRLSSGFRHTDQVVAVGRGYLDAFTATHKWPISLQTYDRGAMLFRYGTRDQSPLSADPPALNRRMPILGSAQGQVYLAFCSGTERELILAMLRASKHPANAMAGQTSLVAKLLADVLRQGYALRAGTQRDRITGFAVPVLHDDGVAATVGMRFFTTTMKPEEAVQRYLAPLRQVAASITAALD